MQSRINPPMTSSSKAGNEPLTTRPVGEGRRTLPGQEGMTVPLPSRSKLCGRFGLGQHLARWTGRGPTASVLLQAWRLAAQLQNSTRCLRKACRLRKTEMVAEVVRSDNIWQAAKRFAPKAPRRRLQLRSPAGHLQSQQIADYFTSLYAAPPITKQPPLTEDLHIHPHEIRDAMGRLRPGKAMPSTSAPAALWKLVCNEVVPFLATQFRQYLVRGARTMPPAWSLCELVLLPKPGKSLKTPAHLRPICLLPLQAKVLAAVLASRLQPFVARYLEEIPQFAYVHQRSLGQALERVAGHCAEVRALLHHNTLNIHRKRQQRPQLQLCGGCQLSLDISCAYDHVRRPDLEAALHDAKVPGHLIQAILLIHEQARLKLSHCGQERQVVLRRGLRQGCGLAPILWALYSGWPQPYA